jgi:hypothetical protein
LTALIATTATATATATAITMWGLGGF